MKVTLGVRKADIIGKHLTVLDTTGQNRTKLDKTAQYCTTLDITWITLGRNTTLGLQCQVSMSVGGKILSFIVLQRSKDVN